MRSTHNFFSPSPWHPLGKHPSVLWLLSGLWLVLVCGLAFLWHLGSTGLVDETEPLFAEAARQMTVTGDWITPYFNGATRFDKPPLIYWLMAIAYHLIGVNEWAVRLPSALAAIALTLFGFFTLRSFATPLSPSSSGSSAPSPHWRSACIGAALIALNLQTILWARTGVSDMLLSGCMGSSLLAFFWGYVQPPHSRAKGRWYLAVYVLAALGVLAKGPIGVVLPGLIIAAFLLYLGNVRSVVREMGLWRGMGIFLLLTLPWYILVTLANGDAFINTFFGYHNIERFTRAVNNHEAPWFFYFLVVFAGFAPWSIYLPGAIARLQFWRPSRWRNQPRTAHLGLFALIWFGVIFVFFTAASTKLPSYVLPLIPAAAILVGLLWGESPGDEPMGGGRSPGGWISGIVNIAFFIALAGVFLYSPVWMSGDPAMPHLPEVVQQSGVLKTGMVICLGVAGAQLILLFYRQECWLRLANMLAVVALLVGIAMPFTFLIDTQRQLPLRQLAATILQEQRPRDEIVMVGFPKPSLVFYTQQPVTYVVHTAGLANRLHRQYYFKRNIPPPMLIVGLPRKLAELNLQPGQYQMLGQAGAYELIRVELPLSQ